MRAKRNFWADKTNQQQFLKSFASKLNITSPTDWKRVTNSIFISHGGRSILGKYNNSLSKVVKSFYSGDLQNESVITKDNYSSTPRESFGGRWRTRKNFCARLLEIAIFPMWLIGDTSL